MSTSSNTPTNTLNTNVAQGLSRVFFGDATPVGETGGQSATVEQIAKLRAELFRQVLAKSAIVKITGDEAPSDRWLMNLMRFTPIFDWMAAGYDAGLGPNFTIRAANSYFELYSGEMLNDSKCIVFGQRMHFTLPLHAYEVQLAPSSAKIMRIKHSVFDQNNTVELFRQQSMRGNHIWHSNARELAGRLHNMFALIVPRDGGTSGLYDSIQSTGDASRLVIQAGTQFANVVQHVVNLRDTSSLSLAVEQRPTDDRCGGHPHSQHASREISHGMCQGTNPFWKLLSNGGASGRIKNAGMLAGALDNLATWLNTANMTDMYGQMSSPTVSSDRLTGMQPEAMASVAMELVLNSNAVLAQFLGTIDDLNTLQVASSYGSDFTQRMLKPVGMRTLADASKAVDISAMSHNQVMTAIMRYVMMEMDSQGYAAKDPKAMPRLISSAVGALLHKFSMGGTAWKASSGTLPCVLNNCTNMHAVALANALLIWCSTLADIAQAPRWEVREAHMTLPAIFDSCAERGLAHLAVALVNATMLVRHTAWNAFIASKYKRWEDYVNSISGQMAFRVGCRSFDINAFKADTVVAALVTKDQILGNGFFLPYMSNRSFATWLFSPAIPFLYHEYKDTLKKGTSKFTDAPHKTSAIYKDMGLVRESLPKGIYNW